MYWQPWESGESLSPRAGLLFFPCAPKKGLAFRAWLKVAADVRIVSVFVSM